MGGTPRGAHVQDNALRHKFTTFSSKPTHLLNENKLFEHFFMSLPLEMSKKLIIFGSAEGTCVRQ